MISMDVVIQITGFGGDNSPFEGRQQTDMGLLRKSVTSPIYDAKPNRRLTTITYTGGQNPDPSMAIATDVMTALFEPDCKPGVICLYGGSAGGKNVIAVANQLSNPPYAVPLAYVGSSDGAFFDNDAVEGPNWDGTNLLIRGMTFSARETANIYQTAGNDTGFSLSKGKRVWLGKMKNKEIHGPIKGFVLNRDVNPKKKDASEDDKTSWEAVHANAVSDGDKYHVDRIQKLLEQAT